MTIEIDTATQDQLEAAIAMAMEKVSVRNELLLPRYLPDESGYRIHHLVMPRMKKSHPAKLLSLLDKYILSAKSPRLLPEKPRKPRKSGNSERRTVQVKFTKSQISRLVEIVRSAGDKELFGKLAKYQSFSTIKKQVKQMADAGQFDPALLALYESLAKEHENSGV